MIILLTRFLHFPNSTIGLVEIPNGPRFYSVERPWEGNEPFMSCIPIGLYQLEWDTTGRIRNVPRLRRTEPRTQINIHVANRASELHGCIGLGMDYAIEGYEGYVKDSKKAMDLFLELVRPNRSIVNRDGEALVRDSENIFLAIEDFSTGV